MKIREWNKPALIDAVKTSTSYSQICKKLKISLYERKYIKQKCLDWGISLEHITGLKKNYQSLESRIGTKIGNLLILDIIRKNINGKSNCRPYFKCKCLRCGKEPVQKLAHAVLQKTITSCGCAMGRGHRKLRGKNHRLFNGYEDITGKQFSKIKTTATRRGYEFLIEPKDVWDLYEKQNRKCALSGVDVIFSNNVNIKTASIDRIDNNKGYTKDNIQIVHKIINIMRNVLTVDEFINFCKRVVETNGYQLLDRKCT